MSAFQMMEKCLLHVGKTHSFASGTLHVSNFYIRFGHFHKSLQYLFNYFKQDLVSFSFTTIILICIGKVLSFANLTVMTHC